MNQELIDAISDIVNNQASDEQKHFLENVEFETKEEWLEKIEDHMVYKYMILSHLGDMQAVAEEVEHLWIDFFAGGICCDWNPEDEAEEPDEAPQEEEEATQEAPQE